MRTLLRLTLGTIGLFGSWGDSSAGAGPEMGLVPVGSSGPHVIVGNQIMIPSGPATIELEIRVSGLQEDGEVCPKAYQATIDSTGYSSGLSGLLTLARIACQTDDDCFGGSVCADAVCDARAAAFIDVDHSDFLFDDIPAFVFAGLTSFDYRFGGVMFLLGWQCHRPDSGYCGTLILHVSEDAAGEFTVGLLADPETWLVDIYHHQVLPLTLTPASITIRHFTLDDFAAWDGCVTGRDGGAYPPECETFDFNHDGDVDLQDFASAQILFVPADPP